MEKADNAKVVTPEEVKSWISAARPFYLIDVLPGDHFRKVHLPNAVNACVYEVVFLTNIKALIADTEGEIVVYGSGSASMDSRFAAEKLLRAGYRNVAVLESGIAGWRDSGYPLEGEQPEGRDDPGTHVRIPDGAFRIDPQKSLIEWAGRNPNTRHYGTVGISAGELAARNGVLSGTFEVDMRTIKNINLEGDELQPVLTSHLMSDDFFFVELFPKATFSIENARPAEPAYATFPNFEIEGLLELRGVKAKLQFPATLNVDGEGNIQAEAHFDIDRTRWNVIYGSSRFFEHLGMHTVFDLISIQIRIIAR